MYLFTFIIKLFICLFRRDLDVEQCKAVHKEVVRLLKDQIKLVNQRLLLQDLYDCRICNHLLEPETSEDVWRHEDMKGKLIILRNYLVS